jgi:uncharacterized protein (DUF1015 family)
MPQIEAFRGIRYDLGHVGSLSDVVAPPYDVINDEMQDGLYKRHPANVIRLILNREEPGDDDNSNRYLRAARFLKNWQGEGVLSQDAIPAVYVYHQVFEFGGVSYTRRGFMARLRLERFGEGRVYPHEETHAAAKADRLKLTEACQTNLSQIFGIYPDSDNAAQDLLEDVVRTATPVEATDHLGVLHRIWAVTDLKLICDLSAELGEKPLFVADGHHRYETACNYRDQLAAAGSIEANHPANYVMTMFVGMSDPGMIVLPTHRLFEGLPALSSAELAQKLGTAFDVEVAGKEAADAKPIWRAIANRNDQGCLAFFTQKDNVWTVAKLTEAGKQQMASVASEMSDDWQSLGVSLLHRLVMDRLLGAKDLPKPTYVHRVEEVISGLESSHFPLAALVMPATLEHIRSISEHGERMPAKSTYFFPKLLSGLVLNPLS